MRQFRLLFAGALVTSVGTGISAFGLAAYMFQRYGSVSAVAAAQLSAFTPLVLLAPIAGTLADRYDRRLLMILGDAGSVIGLAIVAWAASAPDTSPGFILFGIALSSTLAALTEPALQASVTELVPDESYVRASGMLQLASSAKFLISPLLAGLLLAVSPLPALLFVDMSTCLVTVACTLVVRSQVGATRARRAGRFMRDLASGWKIMGGNDPVRRTVWIVTALAFTLGIVQVVLRPVLLATSSVAAAGTAETVAACGLIAGAAIVAAVHNAQPQRLLTAGMLGAGLGMAIVPIRAQLWWITLAAFLVFAALSFCNAGAEVIVRRQIPNEQQGRAWGTIGLVSQLGFVLAYLVAGPIADHVFEPLLMPGGALASTIGDVTGVGPGRGSALMIGCVGVAALLLSRLPARALKDA